MLSWWGTSCIVTSMSCVLLNLISFNSVCKFIHTVILISTSRWQTCFTRLSLCQAGEWSEWCLPAVSPLWRCGGWKGFWVRFLTEEDERLGQADSNPPGVAAPGSEWRGGQPHTAQTATRGEGLVILEYECECVSFEYDWLYIYIYIPWLLFWCRCSLSGSQPRCRGRFCLFVSRRISQEHPSATSLSERASTVSTTFVITNCTCECWIGGVIYTKIWLSNRPSQRTIPKRLFVFCWHCPKYVQLAHWVLSGWIGPENLNCGLSLSFGFLIMSYWTAVTLCFGSGS